MFKNLLANLLLFSSSLKFSESEEETEDEHPESEPDEEVDIKLRHEEKIFFSILLDYEEIDETLLVVISEEQGLPKIQPRGIMTSLIRKVHALEPDLIEVLQGDDGNIIYTITDIDVAKSITF